MYGRPMTKPRILLVDDDASVRDMLQSAMEGDGFEVVQASNVTEALKCIVAQDFDVLLSDLHMPNAGDGFTVVSAMHHAHPQAVTLVLSGYPELQEAMSAIRMQADEVLVKPVQIASLKKLIHQRLDNREPQLASGGEKPDINCRARTRNDETQTGLHDSHGRGRVANLSGEHLSYVEQQPEHRRFQQVAAGCNHYRRRGGFAVETGGVGLRGTQGHA